MAKKISKDSAIEKLWHLGELSWKLKGKQKNIYKDMTNSEHDVACILVSRRFGKCLAEGTLIPTTDGMKKIEDIEIGDFVYGYNKDEKVEITEVKQLHDQGIKEVVDLVHNNKVYATATEDHRFLTYNSITKNEEVKSLKNMNKHDKICKESTPQFNVNEKHLEFKLKNKRKMQCWDIGIDNGTHLFVMDNGLVTHNSFTNCLVAVETCLKTPNAIVKYACPKQRMVATIIKPIMREILKDCPEELKPEWKSNDKIYVFPNGSEIQIAGTDNGSAENLRGGYAQLLICDEAGFMSDLDYVVNSILLPTTDTTDGKLILTSTPNYKDPQHEFHESFIFPIEAEGRLIKYTLHDSPMVDDSKIQKIISRYPGGEENPKFRCEYLCEIPRLTENTVIPEFSLAKNECLLPEDTKMPHHYDAYVSGDVGFRDLTVMLFGYYDFMNAQLVITDELVMNGPEMTTQSLAQGIKEKEELRFYSEETNLPIPPYLRILDNDLKLINDLVRLHDLHFIATKKDNKEAQINQVRLWVTSGKIKIHPRCVHLLYHIENAQWDKQRKGFKHLKDSPNKEVRGGHCDALDALIYMVRNINESRNPFPEDYNELKGPDVFKSMRKKETGTLQNFMNTIMGIKK